MVLLVSDIMKNRKPYPGQSHTKYFMDNLNKQLPSLK